MASVVVWIVCQLLELVTCSLPQSRRVNQNCVKRYGLHFHVFFLQFSIENIVKKKLEKCLCEWKKLIQGEFDYIFFLGYASRCHSATETVQKTWWGVYILRGQCGRDSKQQRWNERLRYHWSSRKGMRRFMASYCFKLKLYRLKLMTTIKRSISDHCTRFKLS